MCLGHIMSFDKPVYSTYIIIIVTITGVGVVGIVQTKSCFEHLAVVNTIIIVRTSQSPLMRNTLNILLSPYWVHDL